MRLAGCITYLFFLSLLLLQSCGSSKDGSRKEVSATYNQGDIELKAVFKVYHFSSDSSRIFVRMNTDNLLYSRSASQNFSAQAQVKITPKIIGEDDARTLPSKKIRFSDIDDRKVPKEILATADFYLPAGKRYELLLEVTDLNRMKTSKEILVSDKAMAGTREFFLARDESGLPLFTDRIVGNERYTISTSSSTGQRIYVRYYNRKFPLPPPPFAFFEYSPFDYNADETYILELDANQSATFDAAGEGFYHFQTDTAGKEGFTLFISSEEFPEVKKIENMVDPFRFLVSGKEYKEVITAADMKAAVEGFWIDWSGNKERARSSIKAYYSRVEDANEYFSSHVEGWKSDRGMIYMIYGKPNKVYRTPLLETWIYGEENNPLSITFNFVKVINPFTSNDYRLNREDYYKPSWYRSIEAWRNGRVY
jgi:GWxTD domain-containing protein